MLIALYVDDLLIALNNISELKPVKDEYLNRFKIEDLGEPQEGLGL